MLSRLVDRLFPGRTHRALALRAERLAAALTPGAEDPADGAGTAALLRSVCARLERLAAPREAATDLPPLPAPGPRAGGDGPPVAALELVRLRDKLALVRVQGTGAQPEVVAAMYDEIGRILALDEVETLEDGGRFDPEYQEVMEMRPAPGPAHDDHVCATIRPGYRFRGEVIRPQQVVVFAAEAP